MGLIISASVIRKLQDKHNVTPKEIEECFHNREGNLLEDVRDDSKTDPPTMWFVAETNHRRRLKVCFVKRGKQTHIKTAYEANADEVRIYDKYAR